MDEREVPVDAPRQQRRVLVVGLHDEPASLEAAKVLGESEGDARAALAERRVRDRVLAQLFDESDPRILDAPQLLGVVLRVRTQRGLPVDDPAVHTVGRAGGTEVRVPASVLDATEQ